MVSDPVCKFNQFGYCKFRNNCFRKHVNTICENVRCFGSDCQQRHPRKCRYFSKYNYCKFGEYCKFKHDENINNNNERDIANLKSEIEALKKVIKAKEAEIKEKNLEIKQCFEDNHIKRKEKDDNHENAELSQIITELRNKVKTMKEENETLRDQIAVSDMLHEDFKERMRGKYLYNTDDTESDYESNEEIREKRREISRKRKIEKRRKKVECNLCDFKAKNETGLKTHVRKKHNN